MDSGNAQKMLEMYIHDYLVKKGLHEIAEAFVSEVDAVNSTNVVVKSPEGFLAKMWDVYYASFISKQAEHDQESYAQDTRTMDNMADNRSPMVRAFNPERSQETSEDEVTSNLRFLEMDHPSRKVPFVINSSYLMEQPPNIPQQSEARALPSAPALGCKKVPNQTRSSDFRIFILAWNSYYQP